MAKFKSLDIDIPSILKSYSNSEINYSKPHIIEGNENMLAGIESKYKTIAEKWGNVFEINDKLIYAFIATESGGINRKPKPNFGPTGLMQIAVNPVAETIYKFKRITNYPLPTEAKNYLNQKASFLTKLNSDILSSSEKQKVSKLLEEPEFNIFCGIMHIRWLIERFEYLNKVIIAYNAGSYTKVLTKYANQNVPTKIFVYNESSLSVKPETKGYLVKMLGVNGFLELLLKK